MQDIAHVINYDLPEVAENFIHRVGRTGRNGGRGIASTLFVKEQRSELFQLERSLGIKIERLRPESIPAPTPEQVAEQAAFAARAAAARPERSSHSSSGHSSGHGSSYGQRSGSRDRSRFSRSGEGRSGSRERSGSHSSGRTAAHYEQHPTRTVHSSQPSERNNRPINIDRGTPPAKAARFALPGEVLQAQN